jgi:probable DNA metabolism protein
MGVVIARAQPYIRCDGLPNLHWAGMTLHRKTPALKPQKKLNAAPAAKTPLTFETDGSFDGLLTALFEAYAATSPPDTIESAGGDQFELFERRVTILTDTNKSDRVWKGLKKHIGSKRRKMLFVAYLSGCSGIETMIYQYVFDVIPSRKHPKTKVHLSSHIQIDKLANKVHREAHRMKGFIRFQQTSENHYFALISPRYDVLPLVRRHFESRFADQHWIIYDTLRNYGLCYDRQHTRQLHLDAEDLEAFCGKDLADEQLCQTLWQQYYAAVNIQQRNNPKLHLRQLPRRFWRYLPEKQQ